MRFEPHSAVHVWVRACCLLAGGPPTNKHYTNSLRGGSLAFHDTSDKFVTSNDAFFGGNA